MIKKKNDYKKGKLRCWGARLEGWREEWSKAWTKILRSGFPQKIAWKHFFVSVLLSLLFVGKHRQTFTIDFTLQL